MKITDEIKNAEVDVLTICGMHIVKFEVRHLSEKNIVYDIDLTNDKDNFMHNSILYEFDKNRLSIQTTINNHFNDWHKDCTDFNDWHSAVINRICTFHIQ